ncbi:hypothetical protein TAFFO16_176 [Bacillus phage Taffo16]|uniref:AP2/ERF domain-containing protein n=1 Tax=Bacillus phage Taffo16 TaxID=2030094 RepID=A0A249XVB2_9CAUD|nr:hypothetical protein TAFFO16_176 [Bacillus phage Taffo16]
MANRNKGLDRVGETRISREGYIMECVAYNDANNIVVKFDNGYATSTSWQSFNMGTVKNPYHASVHGVGYMGVGKYTSKDENGEYRASYKTWKNMLNRCYNNNEAYTGCGVTSEWHNYQNFSEWYDKHYYYIGESLHLDKDILVKGNKLYSPYTCVFVPQIFNKCFTKRESCRGSYPIGITYKRGKFHVQITMKGSTTHIGVFTSVDEAFTAYKRNKEQYIKELAHEYRDKIPTRLFEALMNYEVEVTD